MPQICGQEREALGNVDGNVQVSMYPHLRDAGDSSQLTGGTGGKGAKEANAK